MNSLVIIMSLKILLFTMRQCQNKIKNIGRNMMMVSL